MNILSFLIIIELFALLLFWFMYYYTNVCNRILNEIDWHFRIFCALICYYTLGKSSSLTWTKEDGEIVKQIFIGY